MGTNDRRNSRQDRIRRKEMAKYRFTIMKDDENIKYRCVYTVKSKDFTNLLTYCMKEGLDVIEIETL